MSLPVLYMTAVDRLMEAGHEDIQGQLVRHHLATELGELELVVNGHDAPDSGLEPFELRISRDGLPLARLGPGGGLTVWAGVTEDALIHALGGTS